ncbi:DUF1656 domain-containing protein [Salinisphaera sp. LB1]|uniref:DUF1656 domain-containing protein n=1 Tax=Salinisphaera sp. LB1 TaxID=2183911 RepID=UPI000D7E6BFF|nr:DUF1656 domain-containing protein [Salinisphaera sp. LB1]AWN15084.1 hypothetical protein SALB1_0877 [Salinisphaera sp. LB1]
MLPETITIGGIYLPVFLGFLAATGVVYFILRWFAQRLHLYRLFWHPALAGAAVFVILLSCLLLWFGP